jgi:hypothetical protein
MYCIGAGSDGGGVDDDGVVHRAVLAERLDDAGDGGFLLTDRDVDADHRVLGAPVLLLVDDRVDGDGGLARLAVADDQLALAAADRDHRVDRLDAGLQRLVHGLAVGDARGDDVDLRALSVAAGPGRRRSDAQRVDHAAEHRLADRHLEQAAGGLDQVALLHREVVAVDDAPTVSSSRFITWPMTAPSEVWNSSSSPAIAVESP